MITPQYEHHPDNVTRIFADNPVERLNVLAANTGHGYPISGDTITDIRYAFPTEETP